VSALLPKARIVCLSKPRLAVENHPRRDSGVVLFLAKGGRKTDPVLPAAEGAQSSLSGFFMRFVAPSVKKGKICAVGLSENDGGREM